VGRELPAHVWFTLSPVATRLLHPAGNPAKNDPFFENTARYRGERAGCPPVSVTFFALYLKKWRKWRDLPAENLANKAGIPIFGIGNVEACSQQEVKREVHVAAISGAQQLKSASHA
jgi:hypothetical protein